MVRKNNTYIWIVVILVIVVAILLIGFFVGLGKAEKEYCTDAQRDVEVCTAQYDPVCGWKSDGTFKQTYSNDCYACMDDDVLFWIEGECPQ